MTPYAKTFTDEERAEYREAKRHEAEERLDALLTEDGWRTWLRLRRNVHHYSFSNQVLIAVQAHLMGIEPTLVKSASRWKRDGYHPAKGSHSFTIWVFKSLRRKNGTWRCCNEERTEAKCPKCGRPDHYFQLGPVFDASQVRSFDTGEAPDLTLPEPQPIEGDDAGWLLAPLAEWAEREGVVGSVLLTCDSEHGEGGSWNTSTRQLKVCLAVDGEQLSDNRRLRTLIHELAHAKGITSKDLPLSYAEAEVAVECVSYIVASTAGLDTSGEAIPYMAGWGGEEVRDKVRGLAKLIDETAKALEQPLVELLRAREEEDDDSHE